MNYEPLIEQLETWGNELAQLPIAYVEPRVRSVIIGLRQVATDLQRETAAAPADVMRAHLDTFGAAAMPTPRQLWAATFRHEDADSEDFHVFSLHESIDGAKKAIEEDAAERGACADFSWFLDVTGTAWLYSVAPDADVDCHCYMVERQDVRP